MEIINEPVKPNSGRDQSHKGAKMDPRIWQIVQMNENLQKWKITDGSINVADRFDSKDDAEKYAKWLAWKLEKDSSVTVEGEAGTSITLKYKKKAGGQALTSESQFSGPKYSEHGDDDKPRNSLYSEPKDAFSATNAQIGGYVRMKLKNKDQILYKVLSGNHGSPSRAGRCYGCGFEVDPESGKTQFHAVKEVNHPKTPRITDKIQKIFTGQLPNLNNKTVGYRVNHFVNRDGHTVVEFDFDISVLDTPPSQLTQAPNNWQQGFRFVDKGNWGLAEGDLDKNIVENSGITHGGDPMGYYFRADEVADGDGSANFQQAVEIEPPN